MNNELKWIYYNHALLPTTAPHEKVDESVVKQGKLWKNKWGGVPLLIRWTTDFDCPQKTEWWYCIKDTPFDINLLKAKRRYEINKGKRNFYVKEINPLKFKEEIYEVYKQSVFSYIKKSYNIENKDVFIKKIENWTGYKIYGAFSKENNILSSYALLTIHDSYVNFNVLKSIPKDEKYGVNAAIVSYILENFNNKLSKNFYICDGERNVLHETFFQEYLEKYFGFRKAYCKLNLEYRISVKLVINGLFPFKKILKKIDKILIFRKINSILYMEELRRHFKKS